METARARSARVRAGASTRLGDRDVASGEPAGERVGEGTREAGELRGATEASRAEPGGKAHDEVIATRSNDA